MKGLLAVILGKTGNVSTIIVAVVVALATWQIDGCTRVAKAEKMVARATELNMLTGDSLAVERAKVSGLYSHNKIYAAAVDSLSDVLNADRLSFDSRVNQFQSLIARQTKQGKLKDELIAELSKGVRVDLVVARYGLFGKLKSCDYKAAYAYGLPELNVCDTLE